MKSVSGAGQAIMAPVFFSGFPKITLEMTCITLISETVFDVFQDIISIFGTCYLDETIV